MAVDPDQHQPLDQPLWLFACLEAAINGVESDTDSHPAAAAAVEVGRHADIGFAGGAVDVACAHRAWSMVFDHAEACCRAQHGPISG